MTHFFYNLRTQVLGFPRSQGKYGREVLLLVFFWISVKATLFFNLGIVVANDSSRYIEYAHYLLEGGQVTHDFNSHYIFYSLFIASCEWLGVGLGGVVILQMVLSALGAMLLFRIGNRISGQNATSYFTTFLFTMWIFAQQWDFYILTDSLFTNIGIAVAYFTLKKEHTTRNLAIVLFLLIIACTVRPNGFIFLFSFLAYCFQKLQQNKVLPRRYLILAIVAFLPFFLFWINEALRDYYNTLILGNYLSGEIISGYSGLTIDSSNLVLPKENKEPVFSMLSFWLNNPLYIITLTLAKLFLFFGHVRPYYSWQHNLFILGYLYPLYILATNSLFSKGIDTSVKTFITTLILSQAFTIAFYMEDWDGRFLVPLLPFIFLLASEQLNRLFYTRFRNRLKE